MINVNQITSTLRGLPDRALQQYAMMHKGDPYILALAVSESNQRKQMRMAGQGQNAGQQPTVADQSIAGMAQQQLPENQGIAQIPAPNMQSMADGGIAGYGDGDDVPRQNGMAQGGMYDFAQRSEPVIRMSGGGVPGYAAGVYNEERFKEFLKNTGKTSEFANASPKERQRILTEFADKTAGPQKAAAPAASTSAAQTPANTSKAYEAGKAAKPYLDKAGKLVKTGAVPVVGGGLAALSATSELDSAKGFYDDPNVSTLDKAKQFTRTAANVGLPYAGGAVGAGLTSFMGGVPGAIGGAAVGTGLASYIDDEGEALQAWRKANPQATPEQTKKAAAALAPAYDGPKLNAAQAERATTGQPTITPVPEDKPNTGGVTDLLPGTARFDTSYKPVTAPTAADAKSKASELYDSKGQIRSLEQKQLQARQDILGEKEERLAQLDAFNKQQGPAFASYEKMLQKEELQDVTDKEKAGLTSLMKGFLAMAAGESPNAATNIAKGAMVGLGDYGDALKEFKKAAKERTKAMADIEQARRSEAKGDFKDTQMFTDRANERLAASDDRFTGLISQITGKESDVAASLFNNMTNNAEETNRMMFKESGLNKRFMAEQAGLNARALMPSGEARTAIMLGSGRTDAERLKSGMGVLQELTADKTGMAAFKILGEINAKHANDPMFKPLTLADLTAFQREYQLNMQAGPKNTSNKPTGKAFD